MLKNKGVSPLIATVLLIGFTVAMAFLVSKWGFKITRSGLETIEDYATQSLYCDEVSIDVYCKDDNKLIKNRGAFKINKLIVRTFKDGKVSTNDMNGVGVKEEIDTTLIFGGSERIEIIPIILDDKKNEEIACLEKKFVLTGEIC